MEEATQIWPTPIGARISWVNRLLTQSILIILTVLFVIFVPFGLLLVSPIYVTRLVVKLIGKWYNFLGFLCDFTPGIELGSMISSRNAIFAMDNIHDKPTANIVVCITVEGILPVATLQQDVLEKIVGKQHVDQKKCMYPQLRQYPKTFLGFFFWKWEKSFCISKHVKLAKIETKINADANHQKKLKSVSEEDILDFHEKLICSPFQKRTSPWEFILVHLNDRDDELGAKTTKGLQKRGKTLMFFKIHHCLCDGFSVLQMLMSDLVGHEMWMPTPGSRNRGSAAHKKENVVLSRIFKILKGPYDQVKQIYYSLDYNLWHNPSLILTRRYHALLSEPIEIQFIKDLKNLHQNSTFTSIILTGISSGIAKYLEKKVYANFSNKPEIPKYLHTICPAPITQRSSQQTLGNLWTFCFVPLPIKINSTDKYRTDKTERLERLNQLNTSIKTIFDSTVPTVNFTLIPCVGSLSPTLAQIFSKNIFSTFITSIFPGPQKECILSGHRVTDMYFSGGLLHGNQGFCITLISYNGKFRIFLLVDKGIIASKGLSQKLLDDMVSGIKNMKYDF